MLLLLLCPAVPTGARLATALACHAHEAAGHGELGGLGEVGQDASGGSTQAALEGGLGLGHLGLRGLASERMDTHIKHLYI